MKYNIHHSINQRANRILMTGHNGFSGLNRRLHELQTDNRIVGFTFSRGTFESPFEKQIEKDRLNHLFRKLEIRKLEI